MPHVYLSNEDLDAILAMADGNPELLPEGTVAQLRDRRAPATKRDMKILGIAQDMSYVRDGEVEIDNPCDGIATISEGDDNGAYVLGWVWADFSGTDLDKEDESKSAHERLEEEIEAVEPA